MATYRKCKCGLRPTVKGYVNIKIPIIQHKLDRTSKIGHLTIRDIFRKKGHTSGVPDIDHFAIVCQLMFDGKLGSFTYLHAQHTDSGALNVAAFIWTFTACWAWRNAQEPNCPTGGRVWNQLTPGSLKFMTCFLPHHA